MIRIARPEDVEQIREIYAPYVLRSTATFEYDVPCAHTFAQRFDCITAQFPWLVWEEGETLLGYAYASPPFSRAAYAWCAELTVYLRPQAQGQGIARALYVRLEELLRRQGYQVAYALVCGENIPSLEFHRRQGYQVRGEFPDCGYKFGRWLSLVWLEKRLSPVNHPTAFPTPWGTFVQSAENFPDILGILSISSQEKI